MPPRIVAAHLTHLFVVMIAAALTTSACTQPAPSPTPSEPYAAIVSVPPARNDATFQAAFPLVPAAVHITGDELRAAQKGGKPNATTALAIALEPYRIGNYLKAGAALQAMLNDYPDDRRALLYLGVTRLFQDEPSNAIESLRAAALSADAKVMADAQWYMLVGMARIGDRTNTEEQARMVCSAGGVGSERACGAVKALTPQ